MAAAALHRRGPRGRARRRHAARRRGRRASTDALGRVLAEDVVAAGDVPPFDNSAMDGFVVAAGPGGPHARRIVGESRAGAPADRAAGRRRGHPRLDRRGRPAGRRGASSRSSRSPSDDGAIVDRTPTSPPGQHVRRAGEDVARGHDGARAPGTRLGAAELGVAVVAGRAHAARARAARASTILATGDELVPPGEPLGPGQIHESNAHHARRARARRPAPRSLARAHVARHRAGHARRRSTARSTRPTSLIVSGGVSVGPHDHVKPALERARRRGALLARRAAPRQADVVRHPRRHARLRPARQPGQRDGHVPALRPPRARQAPGRRPDAARASRATLTEAVPRNPGRDEAVRVRSPTPSGPRGDADRPAGLASAHAMLGADGLALVTAGRRRGRGRASRRRSS